MSLPQYDFTTTLSLQGDKISKWTEQFVALSRHRRHIVYFDSEEDFKKHSQSNAANQRGIITLQNSDMYDASIYLRKQLPSSLLAKAVGSATNGEEKDDAGSCCFELRTPLALYFIFIHQRLQFWRDAFVECGVRIKSADRLALVSYRGVSAYIPKHVYSMHGWLRKKGAINPAYQTRFMRVTENAAGKKVLAYYKEITEIEPKGVILLPGAIVRAAEDAAGLAAHQFEMTIPDGTRTFYFQAPSLEEKLQWLDVLRAGAAKASSAQYFWPLLEGDHYHQCGVSHLATAEEIHKSYSEIAASLQPERNPTLEAKQRLIQLESAYWVLRDVTRRAQYDTNLRRALAKKAERDAKEGGKKSTKSTPTATPSMTPSPSSVSSAGAAAEGFVKPQPALITSPAPAASPPVKEETKLLSSSSPASQPPPPKHTSTPSVTSTPAVATTTAAATAPAATPATTPPAPSTATASKQPTATPAVATTPATPAAATVVAAAPAAATVTPAPSSPTPAVTTPPAAAAAAPPAATAAEGEPITFKQRPKKNKGGDAPATPAPASAPAAAASPSRPAAAPTPATPAPAAATTTPSTPAPAAAAVASPVTPLVTNTTPSASPAASPATTGTTFNFSSPSAAAPSSASGTPSHSRTPSAVPSTPTAAAAAAASPASPATPSGHGRSQSALPTGFDPAALAVAFVPSVPLGEALEAVDRGILLWKLPKWGGAEQHLFKITPFPSAVSKGMAIKWESKKKSSDGGLIELMDANGLPLVKLYEGQREGRWKDKKWKKQFSGDKAVWSLSLIHPKRSLDLCANSQQDFARLVTVLRNLQTVGKAAPGTAPAPPL